MISYRNYAIVTAAYWGFTLTDGALRMLVLLHFHQLGFTPFEIAFLFVLYEIFGIVTNLVGGWIAARTGLRVTLFGGLALQIIALLMLAQLDPAWTVGFSILYVLVSQGLSGIAKDLTKMSAKSAIKTLVPSDQNSALFKWVAALTGSKNTLKGLGFFMGGALLATIGFSSALLSMAGGLILIFILLLFLLKGEIGKRNANLPFKNVLSKSSAINILSLARFFLFGGRDVWFVIGVPLFLSDVLDWTHVEIGTFMAVWVILYGGVQILAPAIIRKSGDGVSSEKRAALNWAWLLALVPIIMTICFIYFQQSVASIDRLPLFSSVTISGLAVFGVVFAINSSVHSYLILAYSESNQVTADVGFYYMANAGGRLLGTLLSGYLYQIGGICFCLIGAGFLIALSAAVVGKLPMICKRA